MTVAVDPSTNSATLGDTGDDPLAGLPLATDSLVAGEPVRLALGTHCGVGIADRVFNDRVWRATNFERSTPTEWRTDPSMPDGPIDVEALLSSDGEVLALTRKGRSKEYLPGGNAFGPEDLAAREHSSLRNGTFGSHRDHSIPRDAFRRQPHT